MFATQSIDYFRDHAVCSLGTTQCAVWKPCSLLLENHTTGCLETMESAVWEPQRAVWEPRSALHPQLAT